MNFVKYQGTGNDFIVINGDQEKIDLGDVAQIRRWCDRRFGIGADGFIVVRSDTETDFEMLYFNADGLPGSLCGNGSRCAVMFAREEGFFSGLECRFSAYDGLHDAKVNLDSGEVSLKMADVAEMETGDQMAVLDTGSPHYVTIVEDIDDLDIVEAGQAIRYSPRFRTEGINVNFVEKKPGNNLEVATYERGVENETLSCGTGVAASVLGYIRLTNGRQEGSQEIKVHTKGGDLRVRFTVRGSSFTDIWLTGPAVAVFSGTIQVAKQKTKEEITI